MRADSLGVENSGVMASDSSDETGEAVAGWMGGGAGEGGGYRQDGAAKLALRRCWRNASRQPTLHDPARDV